MIGLLLWQFVFTLDATDPAIVSKIYKQRQVVPEQVGLIKEEVASENEVPSEIEILSDSGVASESEATEKPGFRESLSNPKYASATRLCMMIGLLKQLTGVNAVTLYSTTLFEQEEDPSESGGFSPHMGTALVGVASFVGAILGPLVQTLFKQRPMFIVGHVLMGLCLATVGIAIQFEGPPITILIPILLFLIIFQSTHLFWTYTA